MLVLEFNELCPPLIERFINEGELPNFKKLRNDSLAMETETDAKGEDLNPWVQWLDLHTGQDWNEHGIKELNKLNDFQGKFTWDILSEKYGLKNWICGSMNAKYSSVFKGRFLPDPWCTDIEPTHDDGMHDYYKFVSQSVHSHSGSGTVSQFEFAKSILKQGVRVSTLFGLFGQILKEKVFKKDDWKRAMWLDRIQLDIFQFHYRKDKPDFATFFSNAVAHFQHHYWKDFEPEKFSHTSAEINLETKDAIRMAYKNTDYLLGKLRGLVGEDTAIVFTTALSQEPYVKNERHYYHITNEEHFRKQFGVPETAKYKPVMAEQFHLELEDEESAIALEEKLSKYVMDSNDYFHVGSDHMFLLSREANILLIQCRCTKIVSDEASYFDETNPDEKFAFKDAFYRMNEVKTGMHNPVGLYWFKASVGQPKPDSTRVKPSQVHNDILAYFGS